MDASRFPITTPYGQVPGYPLNNGWHRGEDRAMPMDTPVLVNGHEIGLSGNSGEVTGPHLHIGRFVGGHDTNPAGGGFHFGQAVVTEIGEDAINGKFVRVQADGASWVYLHLSRQSVPVGQGLVPSSPASPAAPPTPASYQIVETYPNGKQIRLNKQPTNLWGMNYHFDFMKDHPVEVHDNGEIWTVTNKVHHEDGYDYYRRDGQVDGFNVLDCDDYVAPPPPVAAPTPPAAPATFPSAYEPYWLRTTIKWYPTALSARNDMNARGTIAQGNYLTYRADGDMLCLVREKGGEQYWINPADNVEPTPEPVVVAPLPVIVAPVVVTAVPETDKPKPSYHWLNETDRLPYRYRSTNTTPVPMKILEGNLRPNPVPGHWEGNFSMYTVVNGITYFLPDTTRKAGWMYGIPETMLTEVKPGLDTNHNGISDVTEVIARWDKFIDIIPQWVNKTAPIIAPKVKLATKQGRQVIDGIISVKKRKDKIQ